MHIYGCELVAKRTTRRASHDGLSAVEADLAFAHRPDVEIRLAYQQRADFGFAQRAEEFGKAAARHVDIQRLLVMPPNIELDISAHWQNSSAA